MTVRREYVGDPDEEEGEDDQGAEVLNDVRLRMLAVLRRVGRTRRDGESMCIVVDILRVCISFFFVLLCLMYRRLYN